MKHISPVYFFFYMKMACICIIMRIACASTLFSTLIFLHCFPSMVIAESFKRIQLPTNATGPESLAFELETGHFYTGINDGRVLKYLGPTEGFRDFGFSAPNRSKSLCDGILIANLNPACGRPTGLALHYTTKKLYVCDAFFGFGVLGPEGGQVTILSSGSDGQPYGLCDGLDVNQRTGNVYFTDTSANYNISQFEDYSRGNDSTGRLMKYDSKTKVVTVLFSNLSGPAGVAVDEKEKFVMVTEVLGNRTLKIWLNGPKAKKFDIVNRQPKPLNSKRTTSGDFWEAAARVNRRTQSLEPIGLKINEFGYVLQTVHFERWYANRSVNEVQEFDGKLYVGSWTENFVGVYRELI